MTDIEWTNEVWNFLRGCSRDNDECDRCYAMHFSHRGLLPIDAGLTKLRPGSKRPGVDWTGKVAVMREALTKPLHWRKPRKVFVNSMSDLFHPAVPFEVVAAAYGVMAATPRHTYQVLTKRPERALEFFAWLLANGGDEGREVEACVGVAEEGDIDFGDNFIQGLWPLPNVHLGVSAGRQETADAKIPVLLQCPAALHWVSMEPMLGPVDLSAWIDRLGWVVPGGESGVRPRPCDIAWIRDVLRQCRAAKVPAFVKQLGGNPWDGPAALELAEHRSSDLGIKRMRKKNTKGGDPSEWPADLRVRQWPA